MRTLIAVVNYTYCNLFGRETEQRAQKAEESEAKKSAELVEALQRLRAFERQMEELQNGGQAAAAKPQTPLAPPR